MDDCLHSDSRILKILVGNKIDLMEDGHRVISEEQHNEFVQKNKIDLDFQTSAKLDINVSQIFNRSALELLKRNFSGFKLDK